MLLAALVVQERLPGRALLDAVRRHGDRAAGLLAVQHHHLQRRERRARVAVGENRDGLQHVVGNHHAPAAEPARVGQRAAEEPDDLVFRQPLQHEHLAAREKRAVHLERRVLRGRADEDDAALLDEREERVLLRLVEAVDLVDEDDRLPSEDAPLFRLPHHVLDVLDPARHGRERHEAGVGRQGDDVRERGLSHAGRPPEDHRRDLVVRDHPAEDLPLADQMPLAGHFVKGARPEPLRKRRRVVIAVLRFEQTWLIDLFHFSAFFAMSLSASNTELASTHGVQSVIRPKEAIQGRGRPPARGLTRGRR